MHAFVAAIGCHQNPIGWSVTDVDSDFGQEGSATNLAVAWWVNGALTFTTNVCAPTVTFYYVPCFTLCGKGQKVTVRVSDKDGGHTERTWYFDVYSLPKADDVEFSEMASVFDGAADTNLACMITNKTAYVGFCEWAAKVTPRVGREAAGAAGVLAEPNAWLSYALGSEKIIEKAPTNGQMRVEEFAPATTVGSFDFIVGIEGIPVGDDADPDNLARVFGLEGGVSLEDLSSTNVTITFSEPVDGKLKFTAGPKEDNADATTFFMKVKTIR